MEDVLGRWCAAAGEWEAFIKSALLVPRAGLAAANPLPPAVTDWAPTEGRAALVIDLPALKSIAAGLALAARGYCPVPLFNTTHDTGEVIPTLEIAAALAGAARLLPARAKGPPAFLLDANRQRALTAPAAGDYDNRWFVFKSDFPSAARLSSSGIRELLLITQGRVLAADLRNAFAEHGALFRSVLDPVSQTKSEFPKQPLAIARLLVDFTRALDRNQDRSFGKRVVSHG